MTLQHGPTFGFGVVGMKKFPSLLPIVAILGVAVTGCAAFCIYATATKKDVIVKRSSSLPPWERTDLENPTPSKIVTINQRYNVSEQLIELKKELNK